MAHIYFLGDLLVEICDKTTRNNQYPVLTSSKSGLFLQEDYFTKSVASKDNTGYKIIRKGEFTYRSMSDSGYFFINRLECTEIGIVSPAYPVFKVKDEKIVDPNYLAFFFKSETFNKKISLMSKGSTRLSLKFKDLRKIEINLPSLSEQQEVVKVLIQTNNLSSVFEKKYKNLLDLTSVKFLELFGNPVKNSKGFQTRKMIDVVSFKPPKKQINKAVWWSLNLDMIESNTGRIIQKVFVREKDLGPSTYYFNTNCVLYSKLRPYLNKVVCPDEDGFATTELVPLQPSSIIEKDYLAYLLRTSYFVDFVNTASYGAKMPRAPMDQIKNFQLPCPPLQLQQSFCKFVDEVEKLKKIVEKQIVNSNELLEIKMEEYFE